LVWRKIDSFSKIMVNKALRRAISSVG